MPRSQELPDLLNRAAILPPHRAQDFLIMQLSRIRLTVIKRVGLVCIAWLGSAFILGWILKLADMGEVQHKFVAVLIGVCVVIGGKLISDWLSSLRRISSLLTELRKARSDQVAQVVHQALLKISSEKKLVDDC